MNAVICNLSSQSVVAAERIKQPSRIALKVSFQIVDALVRGHQAEVRRSTGKRAAVAGISVAAPGGSPTSMQRDFVEAEQEEKEEQKTNRKKTRLSHKAVPPAFPVYPPFSPLQDHLPEPAGDRALIWHQ